MEILDNGKIRIGVNIHGAELASLVCDGREYLWQADPEFWGRHSPVLFPIVGMVWNKTLRSHGREFTMGQHGFARDMDFTLVSKTPDQIWFRLDSNELTKEKYPYDFSLEIGYMLSGRSVKVMWKVTDTSEAEDMYYQIGAHPAFHWPMLSSEAINAGTAAMKAELAGSRDRDFIRLADEGRTIVCSQIVPGGGFDESKKYEITTDEKGCVPVNTSSFDGDAWVFENSQVNKISLCRSDRSPYLTVCFDAPVVGIWSSPGKNAPFICIEPWFGRADDAGYTGLFENKKWIQKLPAGVTRFMSYTINIDQV